jgi:hypothetical protein
MAGSLGGQARRILEAAGALSSRDLQINSKYKKIYKEHLLGPQWQKSIKSCLVEF